MILRRYQKTLLKRSQPYCAYTRVYMRVDAILSLLTIFNIVIGNIGNVGRKALEGNDLCCCRNCCQCCRSATTGNKEVLPMGGWLATDRAG